VRTRTVEEARADPPWLRRLLALIAAADVTVPRAGGPG
jgi:hypothetical protein